MGNFCKRIEGQEKQGEGCERDIWRGHHGHQPDTRHRPWGAVPGIEEDPVLAVHVSLSRPGESIVTVHKEI